MNLSNFVLCSVLLISVEFLKPKPLITSLKPVINGFAENNFFTDNFAESKSNKRLLKMLLVYHDKGVYYYHYYYNLYSYNENSEPRETCKIDLFPKIING